jgi:hypothetical protein
LDVLGDLTFSMTLRDGNNLSSSINIGAYGGGLEQPYQRQGGWHNEMERIRIRLNDFLRNGTGLYLTNIAAVRLDVGPSWGSDKGRIVIDELMLTDYDENIITGIAYRVESQLQNIQLSSFPNPFSNETAIVFYLKEEENVNIEVYDLIGQKVKILLNKKIRTGKHQVSWNGCDETGARLPGGFYLYRFKAGNYSQTQKMLLMK